MSKNGARRLKRFTLTLFIIAAAGAGLHGILKRWLEAEVRERITQAARDCGAEWVEPERSTLRIDLLDGSVSVGRVFWEPRSPSTAKSLAVSGRVDSVAITGLSYTALFLKGRIKARQFLVRAADLELVLKEHPTDTVGGEGLKGFHVDALDVRIQGAGVVLVDSTRLHFASMAYGAEHLKLDLADTTFGADRSDLELEEISCVPFADSILTVERLRYTDVGATLLLEGIYFGPSRPMYDAQRLVIERDIINGKVAYIRCAGIDPSAFLRGNPKVRSVSVGPTELVVARDKSRPDPGFKHKPLPARMLRMLPYDSGADSLLVERLRVDYYERVDPARGFALIPFDTIAGVLTNVKHSPADTLVLHATGFAFGKTPVALTLKSHVGDSSDLVTVEANIGHLDFPALNNVLVPLTGVATPQGRLDTMIVRMKGRDRVASAQCWMRYEGLKLDVRSKKQQSKLIDSVFDKLVNTAVKSHHTGKRKDEGWKSYAWDRRRDRALFNYLWAGVREGAKNSMLPKVVVENVPGKSKQRRR